MDGASKFVKGDAVAGLIITMINIVGGLSIGVFQRGMPAGKAAALYSLMTVGDGLVSQIPALLFSTATGVIVTRAAAASDLGQDIVVAFTKYPRPLYIGSGLLFALGMIPGLPTIPFVILASLMGGMGYMVAREGTAQEIEGGEARPSGAPVRHKLEERRCLGAVGALRHRRRARTGPRRPRRRTSCAS